MDRSAVSKSTSMCSGGTVSSSEHGASPERYSIDDDSARALVPHDDVIEALTPEGADHAFNERILPGTRDTATSRRGAPRPCCSPGRCTRSTHPAAATGAS